MGSTLVIGLGLLPEALACSKRRIRDLGNGVRWEKLRLKDGAAGCSACIASIGAALDGKVLQHEVLLSEQVVRLQLKPRVRLDDICKTLTAAGFPIDDQYVTTNPTKELT